MARVDWSNLLRISARSASEEELLFELAVYGQALVGADACDIFVNDGEILILRASTVGPEYINRVRLGPGIGVIGQAFRKGEATFIPKQLEARPEYARYPGIDDMQWEAAAALPLFIPMEGKEGPRKLGLLLFRKLTTWPMTGAEKANLTDISAAFSAIIAAFQGAYRAGTNASRIGALSDVSKTIASSPYIEEILQLLVSLTAQRFNYLVCTVRLLDETHQELVLRATQAPAKAYARKRAIKLGESIAGRAIAENRPIIVPDVQSDESYIGHELAVEQGLRSMVCVPLTIQSRVVGVMSCYTHEVREFADEEIQALETLAKQAAVSIEHAKLQVRSTLMQEMHHRVKNNLQQVASLLRLQLRHGNTKTLDEAINDSLSRILAISSVHDLLSREDLDHVGVRSVAEMLVQHQMNTLILPDRHISFDVRGVDVRLSMSQATQVALLLNELIQNAIEHGFHIKTEGEVHVTVEEEAGEISLWVSNSGDPLPDNFDPVKVGHLGMQIVENLARSLGGKFKISNILGWAVAEVRFPRSVLD